MIRFAAFFDRHGGTRIKPQHLAKPSTRSLLSGTHWGFPPADRWMRSMLKEASENTRDLSMKTETGTAAKKSLLT